MSTDKRELIRSKVFEVSAIYDAEETWMKNGIILANGASIGIQEPRIDDRASAIIGEIFVLVGDDEELRQFMIAELDMHAKAGNYAERRKERLGWKPGMTLGTPDVPEEVVAEYEGVTFTCKHCDTGEDE